MRVRANGLADTRFGFAVGKRLGIAVIRNRLKRQLRAIARDLPVAGGWDVVVIARGQALNLTFRQLEQALSGLAVRAGIGTAGTQKDTGQ